MSTQVRLIKNLFNPSNEVDWAVVYEEQLPHVYNYFRYMVGDDALAEDLTSTTFEKAWRSRNRYQSQLSRFTTWLFSIARNVARDHFRKAPLESSLDQVPHLADEDTPEIAAQQGENFERLFALLRRLPAREQELIALKYGAGMTNRAIAREIGISESNVGTILHRVVQKLRDDWER